MKISATLIRTEKGLFRPLEPPPQAQGTAETEAYTNDFEAGSRADLLVQKFDEMAKELRGVDNVPRDLNSDEGLVVTAVATDRNNRDFVIESQALTFDPQTRAIKRFENEVEGRTAMRHTGLKMGRRDAFAKLTGKDVYVTGPLLSLTSDLTIQNPDSEKRARVEHESLTELPSGLFEYEYNLSDNLKMRYSI